MSDDLQVGVLVRHSGQSCWGAGKIVERDGDEVRIYFSGYPATDPDDRIRRFRITHALLHLEEQSHPDLDSIPPVKNGRFVRVPASGTLEDARKRFLQRLPRGFSDREYWAKEREYKWHAHERYERMLRPLLENHSGLAATEKIADALLHVYSPTDGATKLNLLNAQFEFPVLKEAIQAGHPALEYVQAAAEFTGQADPDAAQFDRYARAVAALPSRANGTSLEKWTILTWLPFVADPKHHIFLKPQMTQDFASRMPFELQYRPTLNHTTYARLQQMARRLLVRIQDQELNPEQRELDMIDAHSFMWVVTQWSK